MISVFGSSPQKNVHPGEGRDEVWYREAMFSQVVSCDLSLQEYFTTQGRSTLKDKCERQYWNGPFCELKERIYDEVHDQSSSTIYEQLTTLWLRNRL